VRKQGVYPFEGFAIGEVSSRCQHRESFIGFVT